VHIRTAEDISDVWRFIEKGNQVLLWCQGNVQALSDGDSDHEVKKPRAKKRKSDLDEKNSRVDSVLCDLEENMDHNIQRSSTVYGQKCWI